ncbi:unnamed protein product [Brassicogethes aeneus]|uniref:Vacuolar protein sorting-associated protein TDA6 n=1 Tax=Brassicogethes aeneus TaxID=1431903 RepID=A0A9P0BBA4_BRAAE|nr:unnamed protein product [Brassicogethes aeneus]
MQFAVLIFACFAANNAQFVDKQQVEYLVKKWAPLIWLSPEEKYMPLNAENFLKHVYIADEVGKYQTNFNLESNLKNSSKSLYLVTKKSIDILKKTNQSFIFGKNPNTNHVSVYAIVTYCSPYISFHTRDKENFQNEVDINARAEPNLNFHVTYWVFYPYNEGKEICFLGKVPTPLIFDTCFGNLKPMGNHVGDWEHMSLSFKGKTSPSEMFLAVNDAGVYYRYDPKRGVFKYKSQVTRKGVVQRPKFPVLVRTQGGHPVLFSALGSHGLWSSPGIHEFVRLPKLSDKNGYGVPWKTWNTVLTYHMGLSRIPDWMVYKGRWGNPKSNCFLFKKLGICEHSDGPLGILKRVQDFYC